MLQLLDTAVSLSHSSHHSFASLIGCQTSMASVASWKNFLQQPNKKKLTPTSIHGKMCALSPKSLPIFLFRTGHRHWHTFSLCTPSVCVYDSAGIYGTWSHSQISVFFLKNVCGCGSLLGYKNPLNYIICRTKKLSQFRFFIFQKNPCESAGNFFTTLTNCKQDSTDQDSTWIQGHKCIQMYPNIAGEPPKHGANFHKIHVWYIYLGLPCHKSQPDVEYVWIRMYTIRYMDSMRNRWTIVFKTLNLRNGHPQSFEVNNLQIIT